MVYDYLFYKSYQIAKNSNNFDDTPIFGGIWYFMLGFIFNILTIVFIIEGLVGLAESTNEAYNISKYVGTLLLVICLWLYYKKGNRAMRVVNKYNNIESTNGRSIHPAIVLIIYYVISFGLLMLAGMYRNGDGPFAG